MSEDIMILSVDHGYRNMKTENIVFPTALTELEVLPDDLRGVLQFNGKIYLENGQSLNYIDNSDKTLNSDYYILTLFSIAKELKFKGINDARLHLATGLPQRWYDKQKPSFEKYLSKYRDIKYKYEGKTYNVRIDKVSVYSQGYAAFMSLPNAFAYFDKEICIVDIGGGTINIIRCDKGNVVAGMEGSKIETRATNWLMKQIQEVVESELCNNIPDSAIITYMQEGSKDQQPKNKYEKIMQRELTKYADLIFRMLKEYRINIDLIPVFFIGGGSIIMKNFATYGDDICDINFITDLKANAKGYKVIAKLIG